MTAPVTQDVAHSSPMQRVQSQRLEGGSLTDVQMLADTEHSLLRSATLERRSAQKRVADLVRDSELCL